MWFIGIVIHADCTVSRKVLIYLPAQNLGRVEREHEIVKQNLEEEVRDRRNGGGFGNSISFFFLPQRQKKASSSKSGSKSQVELTLSSLLQL